MIGYQTVGAGPRTVLILNDWMCDTSTWDDARAYLDGDRFTYAFVDLRGYGRSRGQSGDLTVEEAAADVLALADAQHWARFTIVGHSMSSLVALHLAQHSPDRIDDAVVVTPPPPAGFGADQATLDTMRALARSDDATRTAWLRARAGDRLSEGWTRFKAARWRATSEPDAVAGYVGMFASRGLPDRSITIESGLLAITGERDIEIMRAASVTKLLAPLAARLEVSALADCGHYPMQEAPPLLVAILERFLSRNDGGAGQRSGT
jgi:3-oxoadipate enol-lactonase